MTDESISAREQQTGQRTAVEVLDQCLVGGTGEDHHANYDQPMELQLRLRFRRGVEDLRLRIALRTDAGDLVTARTSPLSPAPARCQPGEEIQIQVHFRARLGGANYKLAVDVYESAGCPLGGGNGLVMFLAGCPGAVGVVDLRADIEVDGMDRADRRLTLLGAP
jgi:hypothetical protein